MTKSPAHAALLEIAKIKKNYKIQVSTEDGNNDDDENKKNKTTTFNFFSRFLSSMSWFVKIHEQEHEIYERVFNKSTMIQITFLARLLFERNQFVDGS